MKKTITIKGTGHITVSPDLAIVTLVLKSKNKEYESAMRYAAEKREELQKALVGLGFSAEELKTTNFQVNTEYDSIRDKEGNFRSVFAGYSCIQEMKLVFDFDTQVLSEVLSAVAKSVSEPELNVRFSVKDKTAVNEELLASAAVNAQKKAEILTKASGVKLGDLIRIDYQWTELEIYSNTRFGMDNKCMRVSADAMNMEMVPDDIPLEDSATFTWALG